MKLDLLDGPVSGGLRPDRLEFTIDIPVKVDEVVGFEVDEVPRFEVDEVVGFELDEVARFELDEVVGFDELGIEEAGFLTHLEETSPKLTLSLILKTV